MVRSMSCPWLAEWCVYLGGRKELREEEKARITHQLPTHLRRVLQIDGISRPVHVSFIQLRILYYLDNCEQPTAEPRYSWYCGSKKYRELHGK